jgi:hypothetical protein
MIHVNFNNIFSRNIIPEKVNLLMLPVLRIELEIHLKKFIQTVH